MHFFKKKLNTLQNSIYKNYFLLIYFLCFTLLLLSFLTFLKWGPIITSDTLSYFDLANRVKEGIFPYSSSYSPGYPFLVGSITKISNLTYEKVAALIAFFVFLSSVFLWFRIVQVIFNKKAKWYLYLLIAIFVTNLWWSIKVIYFAHADTIFYILSILIAYHILLWIENISWKRFILICALASMSVWVKYNGLIFLPFLVLLPLVQRNLKSKILFSLLPITIISASFILFKHINKGQVIKHLEINREFVFWQGNISSETLLVNIQDAGKVFIEYFLSNLYRNYATEILNVIGVILILGIGLFLLLRYKNSSTLIFYSFFLLYLIGYMCFSHFTNHTEINQRTMFPAYIFLTISFLFLFKSSPFLSRKILLIFLTLNIARTFIGFTDWIQRAPMDSFVNIEIFKNKKSLVVLKNLMQERNISPIMVYTNNQRYLTPVMGYDFVSKFPGKIEFTRGKFREKSEVQLKIEKEKMMSDLLTKNSILVIFDSQEKQELISKYSSFRILEIESDLIIYK
ncbi:hypothetical protein [Algoriphagus algorifonticola]|uniref:hypothetical protein n=1 Tax=Algoriphagus algorifonticola TaxID=2593007 RepID=UPI0011AB012F|nr:hypothetical protein [Algoriphagus algorifonticola]